MEEQIFNIMLKWINVPYVKGKDYPTGIQGMGPSAQEITSHVMEFMRWIKMNCNLGYAKINSIPEACWHIRDTTYYLEDEEIYQYWLKNIKE
jgi:hypothetical protein